MGNFELGLSKGPLKATTFRFVWCKSVCVCLVSVSGVWCQFVCVCCLVGFEDKDGKVVSVTDLTSGELRRNG